MRKVRLSRLSRDLLLTITTLTLAALVFYGLLAIANFD
jgi:hypothetical protein